MSQNVFEIVLPQIAPNFSEFIADLLDCGVAAIDFRADAHECRLMVVVDEARSVPAFVKTKTGIGRFTQSLFLVIVCIVCLLVANVLRTPIKDL